MLQLAEATPTAAVVVMLMLRVAFLRGRGATSLSVLQTEDVVVDVVLSRLVRHKLEDLREVHRVAFVNLRTQSQSARRQYPSSSIYPPEAPCLRRT